MKQAPLLRREVEASALVTEIAVASIGGALVACAAGVDQRWLDNHLLPSFFWSRQLYVMLEASIRIVAAALGAALALIARPRIGRLVARTPEQAFLGAIAVVLALGTSELVLRRVHFLAAEEQPATQEPLRRPDARLGWVFVPTRVAYNTIGGRVIDYAFDPAGYRVRCLDEPVDPDRPSIVFTGESMMVGQGLKWEETVPAQVGTMMGIQTVNLAVHGFASDQAYLRLQTELPRFRRPVAVVSMFMPALFDRNLDDDRPHLGPGLVWLAAERRWRLAAIGKLLVPYRDSETIERGITVTRAVLRATIELARARGAAPLIILPQFGPEEPSERTLRRRVLDEAGLPYLWIDVDPSWRIPWDRHPDPRAAHTIGVAVAARLRQVVQF